MSSNKKQPRAFDLIDNLKRELNGRYLLSLNQQGKTSIIDTIENVIDGEPRLTVQLDGHAEPYEVNVLHVDHSGNLTVYNAEQDKIQHQVSVRYLHSIEDLAALIDTLESLK